MKRIWKLEIEAHRTQYNMPTDSEILCVQVQHGKPHMWFMCNSSYKTEVRSIVVVGTGHEIDESTLGRYINTFQLAEGSLVFHVFEGRP